MNTVDGGDLAVPTDIIDAGDTASPPADIVDSMYQVVAQTVAGTSTPSFEPVDSAQAIPHQPGLAYYVKVSATATTVTMQVPGVQPYTAAPRDDLTLAGLQNTERVFYISELVAGPADDQIAVAVFSQTVGVTSALLKVG